MPLAASRPGRRHHRVLVGAAAGDEAHRPPTGLMGFADRLRAGARRHAVDQEHVGLGIRQCDHLRIHRRIGDLEARRQRDRLVGVGPQRLADAAHVILSGIVVLIEDRKARVWILGPRVADLDAGFLEIVGGPRQRHQPGLRGRLVPFRRRADQEQMRHLGTVEVFRGRRTRRGAHGSEHEGDAFVFDQPAGRLDRLGRREAVVERYHVKLAPVDAAFLIDHVEIGRKYLAGDAERRCRTAIRHDVAELDLGIGNAGLLGRDRCPRRERQQDGQGKFA